MDRHRHIFTVLFIYRSAPCWVAFRNSVFLTVLQYILQMGRYVTTHVKVCTLCKGMCSTVTFVLKYIIWLHNVQIKKYVHHFLLPLLSYNTVSSSASGMKEALGGTKVVNHMFSQSTSHSFIHLIQFN